MKPLWIIGFTIMLPVAAMAQTNDQAYCKALSQKYRAYIGDLSTSRTASTSALDAQLAIEQCKAGNAGAAIPVLEKKLRDARIDLPPRS